MLTNYGVKALLSAPACWAGVYTRKVLFCEASRQASRMGDGPMYHIGPGCSSHSWGLMLCSHHIEALNDFTFEFVFCKQSLMGHYMCPELGPLAYEGSGSCCLWFPDKFWAASSSPVPAQRAL